MIKEAYIKYIKNHKDSQGKSAPYCIVSHETGKILSSHSTQLKAKKHLQDMHVHGGNIKMDLSKIITIDEMLKEAATPKDMRQKFLSKEDRERYEISWWVERDRASVVVTDTKTDKDVFEAWDDDVRELIEDGFIKWEDDQSVLDYMEHLGIIKSEKISSIDQLLKIAEDGEKFRFPYHVHPSCEDCKHLTTDYEEDNIKQWCSGPDNVIKTCPIYKKYDHRDSSDPSYKKRALEEWKYPRDYFGESFEGYYIVAGRHRDSDHLQNSNFDVALEMLGGEDEDAGVIVARSNHWAVGWIEELLVSKDAPDKIAIAEEIERKLEDYPLLDDEDFSRREYEEYIEMSDDILREIYHELGKKYDDFDDSIVPEETEEKIKYNIIEVLSHSGGQYSREFKNMVEEAEEILGLG